MYRFVMNFIKGIEFLFRYTGRLGIFVKDIFYFLFTHKRTFRSVSKEITFVGVDSLFLVTLISFFIGVIVAFQTAYQLKKFSSEIYIAALVALSITRELGPVLTALIVAARSGASITAGIGAMKISEQIDALEAFAVNPVDYLVVPKFVGFLFSLPLLTIYADFLGILGGYVVGATKFSIPFNFYFSMTFDALKYKDVGTGLLKSFCFAGIIASVSCFEGLRPLSSSDVAKVVTQSVVKSFFLIIIFDCILTALFYFVFV